MLIGVIVVSGILLIFAWIVGGPEHEVMEPCKWFDPETTTPRYDLRVICIHEESPNNYQPVIGVHRFYLPNESFWEDATGAKIEPIKWAFIPDY